VSGNTGRGGFLMKEYPTTATMLTDFGEGFE
jgi:hypothetical protein